MIYNMNRLNECFHNGLAPDPPIPTAFEVCTSIEQQILWLRNKVKDLEDRVAVLEQKP